LGEVSIRNSERENPIPRVSNKAFEFRPTEEGETSSKEWVFLKRYSPEGSSRKGMRNRRNIRRNPKPYIFELSTTERQKIQLV
jgi:hypothetical protein